jgi:hypothetical protein
MLRWLLQIGRHKIDKGFLRGGDEVQKLIVQSIDYRIIW